MAAGSLKVKVKEITFESEKENMSFRGSSRIEGSLSLSVVFQRQEQDGGVAAGSLKVKVKEITIESESERNHH